MTSSLLAWGLSIPAFSVQAQDLPGALPGYFAQEETTENRVTRSESPVQLYAATQAASNEFETTTFTFNDITIFSYFDGTEVSIFDTTGTELSSISLNANEQHTERFAQGIYRIKANQSFTVLVGDAVSSSVQGFFAVDQSGRGTSTLLNTFMVNRYTSQTQFIVFGYQNGTEFSIRNLETGDLLYAGTLQEGQYYSMPNPPNGTFLQVSANKAVSALSYGDQDYYVPASNGTFAGETFYGFSGYIGGWENSITVTAYHDDTQVTITNTDTGEVIDEYELDEGQVNTFGINAPTFWTVKTSRPVTVANIPFSGWTGSYAYMTRAIDQTGTGAGTLFYVPVIGSQVDVASFSDGNKVKITKLGLYTEKPYTLPETVSIPGLTPDADGFVTLNNGDVATFNTESGAQVYKVESTDRVSVLQSNNGFGADFMPLNFALELPDLSVSADGVSFSPANTAVSAGDNIDVTVNVKNIGVEATENIRVNVYEGDPVDGVVPLVATQIIDRIDAGADKDFTFAYSVPKFPEYRKLVILVDPNADIVEANSSNNQAEVPLLENEDLTAPLALYIEAEDGLEIDENGVVSPNPFTVKLNLFNSGLEAINNVTATITLLEGLSLNSSSDTVTITSIPAQSSDSLSWEIAVDSNVSGFNRYEIQVTADNLPITTLAAAKALDKTARRVVNVPDLTAPAKPQNFTAVKGTNDNSVKFSWSANTEFDVAGYIVSRKSGTQYTELVRVSTASEITVEGVTGLPATFSLQAFDSSNNVSGETEIEYGESSDDDSSSGGGGHFGYAMMALLLLSLVGRRKRRSLV
ncbi:MAG: hypothetical protein MJA28_09865 [Gammaproteobacteria bacterium]|nr:hypothetical protein [Gammaproteobacteria bacterium]